LNVAPPTKIVSKYYTDSKAKFLVCYPPYGENHAQLTGIRLSNGTIAFASLKI